ncbi:MAG: translation initiation factor SUI1 [Campylobacterota bacterium]
MFEIGAKLEEDNLEIQGSKKSKKQKQKPPKSSSEILPQKQHQLVFTFERKNGKPVTRVGRFYLSDKDKKQLLKLLKTKLACGGKIADEWIELQGDNKEKVKETLTQKGWKFR